MAQLLPQLAPLPTPHAHTHTRAHARTHTHTHNTHTHTLTLALTLTGASRPSPATRSTCSAPTAASSRWASSRCLPLPAATPSSSSACTRRSSWRCGVGRVCECVSVCVWVYGCGGGCWCVVGVGWGWHIAPCGGTAPAARHTPQAPGGGWGPPLALPRCCTWRTRAHSTSSTCARSALCLWFSSRASPHQFPPPPLRSDTITHTMGILAITYTHTYTHKHTHAHARTRTLQPYALHATFQSAGTFGKRHRMSTHIHTHAQAHTRTYACTPQPYALHATFQFAGTPGKRHRMRAHTLTRTHTHTHTRTHIHTHTHACTHARTPQPYALHATFQFAGTPGKRHRMRAHTLTRTHTHTHTRTHIHTHTHTLMHARTHARRSRMRCTPPSSLPALPASAIACARPCCLRTPPRTTTTLLGSLPMRWVRVVALLCQQPASCMCFIAVQLAARGLWRSLKVMPAHTLARKGLPFVQCSSRSVPASIL